MRTFYCQPCKANFGTRGKFTQHVLVVHHANRATLSRTLDQCSDGIVMLVRTQAGRIMYLYEPRLL